MNHTKHYSLLLKRNEELKRALLPKKRSPTGNYKNSTYERVLGYKLLIHAELEYYFEEVTKSIIKKAKDKWDKQHEATPTLVALMAYCTKDFVSVPDKTSNQHSDVDLYRRVNTAVTEHHKYISANNHGIKEKNILALLLPIGMTINEIDNNLLIALDSFGSERGAIAHQTKAQQCLTPDEVEASVDNILTLLDTFDEKIVNDYQI